MKFFLGSKKDEEGGSDESEEDESDKEEEGKTVKEVRISNILFPIRLQSACCSR